MLAFLHTAASHVPTFTRLAKQLDSSVLTRHKVREDLFAQALADGQVTDATRRAVQDQVRKLAAEGARVVVCTCSTLGEAAEQTPDALGITVLRIDRPMMKRAAGLERSILLVAATSTAMAMALTLLGEAARSLDMQPVIRQWLCNQAWERFQAGDQPGYAAAIAEQVVQQAQPNDVVILAQASMAPAALLISRADIEVLTSPEIGVKAAIDAHLTAMARSPNP